MSSRLLAIIAAVAAGLTVAATTGIGTAAAAGQVVTCSPKSGTAVEVGAIVTCRYHPAKGDRFTGWGGDEFSPSTSFVAVQTFTALTTGTGTITGSWDDAQGNYHTQTFTYTISPATKLGKCSPGNGTTIGAGDTVTCSWKGPAGDTFVGWGGSLFTPSDSASPDQAFTPTASGDGSITLFWQDPTGAVEQQSWSYAIGPPIVILATPYVTGADGDTVSLNGVATPGPAHAGDFTWNWGDGHTTHGFFPQAHHYGQPGTYTITVSASDAVGTGSAQISVTTGTANATPYGWSPDPIGSGLQPGQKVIVTLTFYGPGGLPAEEPSLPVWLSFNPAPGGGTAIVASGYNQALTATPEPFVSDSSGQLQITYTAPATLPAAGSDTLIAQNAPTGPTVTLTDTYAFG